MNQSLNIRDYYNSALHLLEIGYEIEAIQNILAKKGIDENIIKEVIDELQSFQYEKFLSRKRKGTTLLLCGVVFLTVGFLFMMMSDSIYTFNSLSAALVSIGMIGISGGLLIIFAS